MIEVGNPLRIKEFMTDLSDEQISMIDFNLGLSIDERITQLQSALNLIEELRRSMDELNDHRLQNPTK